MTNDYDIIVKGNSLRLAGGFLGLANLTLIQTQGGPMLFDVGHHANRDALILGLAQHKLKPSDVPMIFLSHLHFDHVVNIDLFPFSTKVFVSKSEWEYAAAPHKDDPWIPWMIREQLQQYDLKLLEGSGELEADIRYLPVPGHTPGCTALVLNTKNKGRVVIAGDALKFPREAINCCSDHSFDSPEVASKTIKHILEISDRIIPGHFPELIRNKDGNFTWKESSNLELLIR